MWVVEVRDILFSANDGAHGGDIEAEEHASDSGDNCEEVGIVDLWEPHSGSAVEAQASQSRKRDIAGYIQQSTKRVLSGKQCPKSNQIARRTEDNIYIFFCHNAKASTMNASSRRLGSYSPSAIGKDNGVLHARHLTAGASCLHPPYQFRQISMYLTPQKLTTGRKARYVRYST